MIRRGLFLLSLIVLLAPFASAGDFVADTIDQKFDVASQPLIYVRNQDGDVSIRSGSGNVVQAHIVKRVQRAKSEAEAKAKAEDVRVRLEKIGNRIEAVAEYPRSHHNWNGPYVMVEMQLTVPSVSDLDVRTSDGSLDVTGIKGTMDIKTSDGDVKVRESSGKIRISSSDGEIQIGNVDGTLEVHSSDGDIDLDEISGSLAVHTSDGDVRLARFHGSVDASTSDGDISIAGSLKSVNAKCSDGSIEVDVSPDSSMEDDWSFRSTDGDVKLKLPSAFSAELDIQTGDGNIHTDLPVTVIGSTSRGHLQGKLKDGGHMLRIKTSDGSVSINGNQ